MCYRLGLVLAFLIATLAATPASAQTTGVSGDQRISIHFLVRREHAPAVAGGSPYRQAQRTVGLWQAPSREELAELRAGGDQRDLLHLQTVPLVEMNW